MGEIEVFELHVADVVVIRDAVGFRVRVAVCVRPCVGFRAVSGFDDNLFGEDVLLFKQHLERTLYLIQRELALMESRENGDQHIGVMLNIIQIEVIFVIVVSAFIVIQIALQLLLHPAILRLRAKHRVILTKIRGSDYRRAGRGEHRTRADSGTEQNEKGNSDADPDEDLLVLLKELLDLVGRLLTELLAGILCGSPGGLRTGISSGGIFLLDVLLLVVLVHVLLLHLRMLLLISLILELRISYIRLMFQLGDLLIRLVDAAFPMMTEMPRSGLSGNLCFMRRLNRRVFLLDLMDFAVNAGSEGVTDLADGFICLKLQLAFAFGLFQLILKMKAGFALAGLFIEDTLFLENLVRGQLLTGGIQTLMRLLGLPFELLHPLRGRDGIVRDRLCRGSLRRLSENGICINGFNRRGLAQLVRDNRFGNHRAGMRRNAVLLQSRRLERRFRRQRFSYILGWIFCPFLFCDGRFRGRLCVVIFGVFRLKLTLLTAHLHLFLFLRRKSFGRLGCLTGLHQLRIFQPL